VNSDYVKEFNRHENRGDGARVAPGLIAGLAVLRNALYFRVHKDVERLVGRASSVVAAAAVISWRTASSVQNAATRCGSPSG